MLRSTSNSLTPEQLKFYKDNGYIVLRSCVSPSDLERYRNRFQDICERRVNDIPPNLTIMRDVAISKSEFKEGEKAVTKLQDFYDDDELFSYCEHPNIVSVVQQLIGTPNAVIVAMHTMLINKPPDSGKLTSRHPLHQDQNYFPFEPADNICCAWTAMEKINRANGCLVVVPGTHKGPLLKHAYPDWEGGVNMSYHGIQDFDPSLPRTYVDMEPGDTVFFHPLLIHGSGTNKTNGFRKAISCHYANDDVCRYMDHVDMEKNTSLKDVYNMGQMKIKKILGDTDDIQVDYTDMWRLRAKAVNGEKAHL